MLLAAITALFALQVDVSVKVATPPDTAGRPAAVAQVLDPALLADAYLDPGARDLVHRARVRRATVDQSIVAYRALVKERISAGLRALRRDRLLYRRETAARIHWRRFGPAEIEVLGAREAVPIISARIRVPEDLAREPTGLVFDPTDPETLLVVHDEEDEEDDENGASLRHPLAPGSEADYRFASGDTTRLTLPDGRTIRLIELRMHPRRSDYRLLSGSLWLDAETHAVVQAVFRLARPFDLERDAPAEDRDDVDEVPGLLKPIQAELRYVTIDYGLWEMRWWLPRLIALEGQARMGALLRVPIRYERTYSAYEVVGDTVALPPVTIALAGARVPARCHHRRCRCDGDLCRGIAVRLPADSAVLLESAQLPPSIYDQGETLLTGDDVRRIASILERAKGAPAELARPRLYWGLDRPDLIRYNRVEGLSLGARLEMEYGRTSGDLTARIGHADLEPGLEVRARREALKQQLGLSAYRRLSAVDPAARPFGLSNSLGAILFGRDDGDYYRALGIELAGGPAEDRTPWFNWRIYAERQREAEAETHLSLRRLWDGDARFRPNLRADAADQIGAVVELRLDRGLNPAGFRWGGALTVEGATGTFRFARPAAALRLAGPLPGPLIGAVEAVAGTSFGRLPAQAEWALGGPATLRGYDPRAAAGSAFWRGRAEIATAFPAARVALFTDAGRAGGRADLGSGTPLVSAGIGASFLDGLVRFDLARALRAPTGWKVHLYIDGII